MTKVKTVREEAALDDDGFLKEVTEWNRAMAQTLADRNDIGPLTDEHWEIIEYVKDYYATYGTGPAVIKIAKSTGMSSRDICSLFPCGVVRGAYRLAGLPRPPGCI